MLHYLQCLKVLANPLLCDETGINARNKLIDDKVDSTHHFLTDAAELLSYGESHFFRSKEGEPEKEFIGAHDNLKKITALRDEGLSWLTSTKSELYDSFGTPCPAPGSDFQATLHLNVYKIFEDHPKQVLGNIMEQRMVIRDPDMLVEHYVPVPKLAFVSFEIYCATVKISVYRISMYKVDQKTKSAEKKVIGLIEAQASLFSREKEMLKNAVQRDVRNFLEGIEELRFCDKQSETRSKRTDDTIVNDIKCQYNEHETAVRANSHYLLKNLKNVSYLRLYVIYLYYYYNALERSL